MIEKQMLAAMGRMLDEAFFGKTTTHTASKSTPPPLTVESLKKLCDDFNKPPVMELTPQLAELLDKAVTNWEAKGTPRTDLEGIMLLIPWQVSGKQTLETQYGPLEIHFTEYTPFATFLPKLKIKFLYEPIRYTL